MVYWNLLEASSNSPSGVPDEIPVSMMDQELCMLQSCNPPVISAERHIESFWQVETMDCVAYPCLILSGVVAYFKMK